MKTSIYEKLIALVLLLLPMIVGAQTKTNATKTISFCGVPFGISVEEFKQKACTDELHDSLANLVGAKKCIIAPNVNIPRSTRFRTVCSLEISFGDDYGVWVLTGYDLLRNMLCAKYGQYQESENHNNGKQKLIWQLPYGEISLRRGKEDAVISYYDYSALKKELPELFKML